MNRNLNQKIRPYLYTSPALLLIGLIVLFPILYTIYISLTNMNIYHWADFTIIGLKNYARALTRLDEGFMTALLRTILWTAANLVLHISIALALVLMLNVKSLKF